MRVGNKVLILLIEELLEQAVSVEARKVTIILRIIRQKERGYFANIFKQPGNKRYFGIQGNRLVAT